MQNNTETIFTELGGTFCRPFADIQNQLSKIKAYVFDWDGVFNNGTKIGTAGSPFSEIDAMGTNMLRFGHFLKNKSLPIVAVITGEENPPAQHLAQREHFHAVYFKSVNKLIALDHFLKAHNLQADEVAFFFDDVLDLGMAEKCGLRFMIKHHATALFQNYVVQHQLADYVTSSDNHGVREVCEMILGTNAIYDETIRKRSQFDESYQHYLSDRKKIDVKVYSLKSGEVVELEK
jgi:3-deoxy-D-manno-octulosonate 8-phosphate phosphatase (KDO 8-P phosphatase)